MSLLDAICAAPDDDTPRLIHADRLLESDDEFDRLRGELIIAQCTRVKEPMWSAAWQRARATEKRLLPLVRARDDAEQGFRVEEWSRGFPSWIQVAPAALRARADTLRLPLETLSFTTSYEEQRIEVTLGELAWGDVRLELPALVELDLEACRLDDAFHASNAAWLAAHDVPRDEIAAATLATGHRERS